MRRWATRGEEAVQAQAARARPGLAAFLETSPRRMSAVFPLTVSALCAAELALDKPLVLPFLAGLAKIVWDQWREET